MSEYQEQKEDLKSTEFLEPREIRGKSALREAREGIALQEAKEGSSSQTTEATSARETSKGTSARETSTGAISRETREGTSAQKTNEGSASQETRKGPSTLETKQSGCIYLEQPRKGKKLAVLDVDGTIFDPTAPDMVLATRPYLHTALKNIYNDYDIGVWSATEMQDVKDKLHALGVLVNPNYKLLFYMSKDVMVPAKVEGGLKRLVKPLREVWKRYPQFNSQNTVICDDKPNNFTLNPKNGIEIFCYSHQNYDTDDELLRLGSYLRSIAHHKDLSSINHVEWRRNTEDATYVVQRAAD